jgi:hypothetical protein
MESMQSIPFQERGRESRETRLDEAVRARHVAVFDKGNLANPFRQLFEEVLPARELRRILSPAEPSAALPEITKGQFAALTNVSAHESGVNRISAVDFRGNVTSERGKRFVDMMQATGLGERGAGRAALAAIMADGEASSAPQRVEGYALSVSFPEVGSTAPTEFRLTDLDPGRDLDARDKAKAIFEAVAQYVDDGLDAEHLGKYVNALQTALYRIYTER